MIVRIKNNAEFIRKRRPLNPGYKEEVCLGVYAVIESKGLLKTHKYVLSYTNHGFLYFDFDEVEIVDDSIPSGWIEMNQKMKAESTYEPGVWKFNRYLGPKEFIENSRCLLDFIINDSCDEFFRDYLRRNVIIHSSGFCPNAILKLSSSLNSLEVEKVIKETASLELLDYSLYIQPIGHEECWSNCAKVINLASDQDLYVFIPRLLGWIKNLETPGARIVFDRVRKIPRESIQTDLNDAMELAITEDNQVWFANLMDI
ncbi:MAG: hypothetical protein AB9921_07635 [Erysipelotrichaceae bacterium]